MAIDRKPLETASPESVGIPSGAIEKYVNELLGWKFCLHSLLMIKNGKLIYEAYWKPLDQLFMHRLYSCSKSFVSVAVGLLAERGLLSLDDRAISYFPEKASGAHPFLAKATIRDLLLMAAPYETGANYSPADPDWSDTFFTAEVTHLPGQVYSYCTAGTTMLCMIIKRVCGQDFMGVLRPIFDEIGFSDDAFCIESPCGYEWGGSGVVATSRDFAKFALLCARMGEWNGKQLLPREYMLEATSPLIPNYAHADSPDTAAGYGYQFWPTRFGGFAFRGMGGQFAICLPKEDFVLVTTAYDELNGGALKSPFDAMWRDIYPYLKDNEPLQENYVARASLNELTERLAVQAVDGSASSPRAAALSGRTYKMYENRLGLKWVRFDFADDFGVFAYENASGEHALKFGLCRQFDGFFPEDNYFGRRIGTSANRRYRCLTSAAWFDEKSLLMHCQIVDIHLANLRMSVRFDGDALTLEMRKHAEWFLSDYQGFASGEAVR